MDSCTVLQGYIVSWDTVTVPPTLHVCILLGPAIWFHCTVVGAPTRKNLVWVYICRPRARTVERRYQTWLQNSDKYEFVKKAKMFYFTFTLGMFFTKNNQEQIAVNLYSKVNYEMEWAKTSWTYSNNSNARSYSAEKFLETMIRISRSAVFLPSWIPQPVKG